MPTRIEILSPDAKEPHPDLFELLSHYASQEPITLKLRKGGRIEHHNFRVVGMRRVFDSHHLVLTPADESSKKFIGGVSVVSEVLYKTTKTGEMFVPEENEQTHVQGN